MTPIEILSRQTSDAYNWTNKLTTSVSYDTWDNIPDVIETSVSWQVGHLIVSLYYHSIMVIVGHHFFTTGSPKNAIGKARPEELEELRAKVKASYEEQTDIRYGAARGWIDSIIQPHETRDVLVQLLRYVARPPAKGRFHMGVVQV